jgi:hypothetical protein
MDYKFFGSIYIPQLYINDCVFFWRLYEFYLDRRGKLKIITSCVSTSIYGSNNVVSLKFFSRYYYKF